MDRTHRSVPVPRRLGVAAVAIVALVLAGCGSASDSADDAGAGPAAPPAFAGELVGGGELASADLEGRDAVLWFWAPWCTVCRAEAPDVAETVEAYADRDVAIVGVAGRGDLDEMAAFVDETGVGGFDHVADLDGSIWSSYEVVSQPTFAFVDDDGSIELHQGALGTDGLSDRIDALLAT